MKECRRALCFQTNGRPAFDFGVSAQGDTLSMSLGFPCSVLALVKFCLAESQRVAIVYRSRPESCPSRPPCFVDCSHQRFNFARRVPINAHRPGRLAILLQPNPQVIQNRHRPTAGRFCLCRPDFYDARIKVNVRPVQPLISACRMPAKAPSVRNGIIRSSACARISAISAGVKISISPPLSFATGTASISSVVFWQIPSGNSKIEQGLHGVSQIVPGAGTDA